MGRRRLRALASGKRNIRNTVDFIMLFGLVKRNIIRNILRTIRNIRETCCTFVPSCCGLCCGLVVL